MPPVYISILEHRALRQISDVLESHQQYGLKFFIVEITSNRPSKLHDPGISRSSNYSRFQGYRFSIDGSYRRYSNSLHHA